jgi:intracellular multiplication protein IcmB
LAQAERDVREGRKHNVQLGFTSQRPQDIHAGIASQATGVYILGAGDRGDRDELIKRFDITEAGAKIVRHRLTGPRKDGAPFLAIFRAESTHYEQFLVNSLGPGALHHACGHCLAQPDL